MKNVLWTAIHDTFKVLNDVFPKSGTPVAAATADGDAEPAVQDTAQAIEEMPLDQVVQARSRIRSQLDILRGKFSEQLNERDSYLAIFPIVAHFDELVQSRYLRTEHRKWPPLQGELFHIDDAGEVFFNTLDDLMLKPQTLPFLYEVFYLCLNDGFVGRYAGNPAKIEEYLQLLKTKIPLAEISSLECIPEAPPLVEEYESPVWYYVAAGLVFLACYFILAAMARLWNPILL